MSCWCYAGEDRLQKPQPAPVEGLAARSKGLALLALLSACVGRLPGAGCPFESHPAPQPRPHLTPPQPRRAGARGLRTAPRAPAASLALRLAPAGRSPGAPPHRTPYIRKRRCRSQPFKYYLAGDDLVDVLPTSINGQPV
ncbi:hypothetical protein JCM17823_08640 [Halorubrum gandharaense]